MVPDGGLGLFYFIFHYVAALKFSDKIILHHRTGKYIETYDLIMALITRLGGSHVYHVFLSENMAALFQRKYGSVYHRICTNAYFVDKALSTPVKHSRGEFFNLGHLSNLCTDKGFFTVADLFEQLMHKKKKIKLFMAGPILETSVRLKIGEMLKRFPIQFIYKGPIYGRAKERFYQGLDLFVFPSLYSQEAQPNVIYEALAAGVPVIATSRGFISEMLDGKRGFIPPDEDDFVDFAIDCIEKRMKFNAAERQLHKEAIRNYMVESCEVSKAQYAALISHLLSIRGGKCFI
jgi:glycosyltransferase involved in cell wall biosynthesis